MPVIKSAKKQMRQSAKKRARNFPVRSELKSTFKKALLMIHDGKFNEAKAFIGFVHSVIDKAAKKKIIHGKNADRKKSRIARELNLLEKGGDKATA